MLVYKVRHEKTGLEKNTVMGRDLIEVLKTIHQVDWTTWQLVTIRMVGEGGEHNHETS
jgi:hypothetical protein